MSKTLVIFDLDHTVICSKHRSEHDNNGKLNLSEWIANSTWSNIMRDTLLPLARTWKALIGRDDVDIFVCTARDMKSADYAFLHKHGLHAHAILHPDYSAHGTGNAAKAKRELLEPLVSNYHTVIFYDDEPANIEMARELGIDARLVK